MRGKPKKVEGFTWRGFKFPEFNTHCLYGGNETHGRSYCPELMCEVWCEEVKPDVYLYQALCCHTGGHDSRTRWRDSPQAAMDGLCQLLQHIEKARSVLLDEEPQVSDGKKD